MRTVEEKLLDNGIDVNDYDNLVSVDGFCESIVWITLSQEPRLVYDYDKMVEEFAKENHTSEDDACDFICYNTLRSLDYMNSKEAPIVIRLLDA